MEKVVGTRIKRIDRYKQDDDRVSSIVAWNIVHKKLDLNVNQVYYNENGKPFIKQK